MLSTIAANHTKALAEDGGLTSALIDGYQLAFLAGAVAIGTGIVLAFALLRPQRQELQLASAADSDGPRLPGNYDIEDKAA